jgi:hypothetical protein
MNGKWLMVLVAGTLIHKPTSTLHTAAAARGNEPVFRRLQIREHQLITEELCSVSVLASGEPGQALLVCTMYLQLQVDNLLYLHLE